MILAASFAWATPSFEPFVPEARFEGRETWTQAGDIRLWNAVERWEDPDRELFHAESFNFGIEWKDTDASPWIASAFETPRPSSSSFLLHVGLHEPTATGTPILMVPGAGDNGSRGFVTLATKLDRTNRPVFALTFAHPHGDVFLQAETVADAIAVIRARTGAEQVDVVAHSKGGLAVAVYAAHGSDFGAGAYDTVGSRYEGNIRRLVLVASPLGGVDTSYRWTGLNLYALTPESAISPTSWDRYYPNTTAVPLVFDSLADQDFLPDGADLFPGQRQLLRRQDAPLPGSQAWLGLYALQSDWYTTYEGGTGLVSRSDGIDAAIAAGGDLIDRLAAVGIDPDIEVFQLAGTSPLMPNGDDALASQFAQLGGVVDWADLVSDIDAHGIPLEADADTLAGLEGGQLVLGEISDRSDGLVFLASALDDRAITARGGAVVESTVADLSHLDLLYASPITGQLLIDAADAGGEDERWMRAVGERYVAADTLGWMERVLADEGGTTPDPEPDSGGDTGAPTGDTPPVDGAYTRPCGSCATTGPSGWWSALGLAALVRRRR